MQTQSAQLLAPQQQELLKDFGNRFTHLNNMQANLLASIEDKLHNILNRRSPENPAKAESPGITDFITMADGQLLRLTSQNYRLEAILSHLAQII